MEPMDNDRIIPFHTGSQYADWCEKNCWTCAKQTDKMRNGEAEAECEIDAALVDSFATGSILRDIAKRMGWTGAAYNWPCPEWISDGSDHAKKRERYELERNGQEVMNLG